MRAEAGSRPGGRGAFLCVAKEKYPKERRPCCLRPLRCAAGPPGVLGCGVRRGTRYALARCARTTTASQLTKQVCPAAHLPPHALRAPGASTRGWAAEQPHGPLLRSARGRHRGARRRSCEAAAVRYPPLGFPSGCAEERSAGRKKGRALFERSEFARTPPGASTAGCPQRSAGTQRAGSPFLW